MKKSVLQNKFSPINICRVCGMNWNSISKTRETIYDDMCPCCFVQVGYEDSSLESIKSYREHWLQNGAKFEDEELEPEGWNKEMALKQIENNVPKELL